MRRLAVTVVAGIVALGMAGCASDGTDAGSGGTAGGTASGSARLRCPATSRCSPPRP